MEPTPINIELLPLSDLLVLPNRRTCRAARRGQIISSRVLWPCVPPDTDTSLKPKCGGAATAARPGCQNPAKIRPDSGKVEPVTLNQNFIGPVYYLWPRRRSRRGVQEEWRSYLWRWLITHLSAAAQSQYDEAPRLPGSDCGPTASSVAAASEPGARLVQRSNQVPPQLSPAPALSLSPIVFAFVSSGEFDRIPPAKASQWHRNTQKKKFLNRDERRQACAFCKEQLEGKKKSLQTHTGSHGAF